MPIYEYACRDCGQRFEDLVMGSEQPACPRCRGRKLEKLLSVFAARSGGGPGADGGADFGPGPCGTCGDPRGPGACDLD